jgi:AraC-like DNA-binding protein
MRKVLYAEHMNGISIDRIIRDYDYTMLSNHIHDEYEIYFLIAGERFYFIENKSYHIKTGSLVFINHNQIHKTSQSENSFHERALIEFNAQPFHSFLETTAELQLSQFFQEKHLILQLNESEQAYVLSLFDQIAKELKEKNTGYQMITMTTLARIFFFAQNIKYQSMQLYHQLSMPTTSIHKTVSEVASYISTHYDTVNTLEDTARKFYISKSYLSRIFKYVTSYTVNEYINLTRIQQARHLLRNSNLNVSEISEKIGYNSVSYFERVFRKHTETSPLKYRKHFMKNLTSTRLKSFD